jgi:hypothetical protein
VKKFVKLISLPVVCLTLFDPGFWMYKWKKHGQGTHCTKMYADKFAENTTYVQKICLPKPQILGFQ